MSQNIQTLREIVQADMNYLFDVRKMVSYSFIPGKKIVSKIPQNIFRKIVLIAIFLAGIKLLFDGVTA